MLQSGRPRAIGNGSKDLSASAAGCTDSAVWQHVCLPIQSGVGHSGVLATLRVFKLAYAHT